MKSSDRIPALIAYIPVIGWLYVLFFEHKSSFAVFHLRQSVGIFGFILASFVSWAVIGWLLTWIPYGFIFAMALFGIVVGALVFALATWVMGIRNALNGKVAFLPIFGKTAYRLPL